MDDFELTRYEACGKVAVSDAICNIDMTGAYNIAQSFAGPFELQIPTS